jgi:hypothetical protein
VNTFWYYYHRVVAAFLNWRAARASRVMRVIGKLSNEHEALRDYYNYKRNEK